MNNPVFQNPYDDTRLTPGDSTVRTTVLVSEKAKSQIARVHSRSGTLQTTVNILLDKLTHELERIELTKYDPDAYERAVGRCTIIFGPTGDEAYDRTALHFTLAFDAQNRGRVAGTPAPQVSGLGEPTGGQGGGSYAMHGTETGRAKSSDQPNLSSRPTGDNTGLSRSPVSQPEPYGQTVNRDESSGASPVARGTSGSGVEPRDANGAPTDERPTGERRLGAGGDVPKQSKKKAVRARKGSQAV